MAGAQRVPVASELFNESSINFMWDHGAAKHVPELRDVLVTLDASNVAEVGPWQECVEWQQLLRTKRAAWLIHVRDLRVQPGLDMVLPPGWRRCVRLLATFKFDDSGHWVADPQPQS
jgi:hypothetical protein